MLTGAVVPASAVASMPIRPTVRPSMRPNPVTTPSPGTFFPVRRSGWASMPVSNQEPSSRSSAIRSRTGSRPDPRCLSTACSPPIWSASACRRRDSAMRSPMVGPVVGPVAGAVMRHKLPYDR
jgi:hypothetical protein